jgi:hypothetical protein
MSEQGATIVTLEQEFEDHSHPLTRVTYRFSAKDVAVYAWKIAHSFRGLRVAGCIVVVILFACTFFGIENVHGSNLVLQNTTNSSIPGLTAQVSGLAFVDALFISVSLVSSTGLETIDFSQWTLASQIIASENFLFRCV